MAQQLIFDLPVRPALGREDFFVARANELALAALDKGDWPLGKMLLVGPEGAGKSHIARVWAHDNAASIVPADELERQDPPGLPALVIEDADRIAGQAGAETALFHWHNRMLEQGARLLITARQPPAQWGILLADLESRMQATAIARIEPPDDTLLAAVLVKLFADRQVKVAPGLIDWLLRRIDRSFSAARDAVALLDAASLRLRRPVTVILAGEVLDSAEFDGP
ncbi:MAG: chromosomal replication initiator DnaA [Rhodobacteraceae bacterium]|nr:chromosomal replication initiator DnaA [Paracoccaceae bacterium]